MLLNTNLLDALSDQAKASPRLRMNLDLRNYNDKGELTHTLLVAPGSDLVGLCVPMGQWHSLECLESGTVILETKDGAWEPLGEEDVMLL